MKQKIIRAVTVLLVLSFLSAILSGCDNSEPEKVEKSPVAVAIVLGNHSNSYVLNLNSPDLTADVAQATAENRVRAGVGGALVRPGEISAGI